MSRCDWIICERTPHWAPAIRMAIERDLSHSSSGVRLREVRRLDELMAEFRLRPVSFAAVEVDASNIAQALTWLAGVGRQFPSACWIALLDRCHAPARIHELTAALHEAGAAAMASSPRQLAGILEVARRHAQSAPAQDLRPDDASLTALAWSALPWQDG